ncbi:Probable very-long-chain (3R)-3-hydroxyacyl-CoA [Sparassis crispa]|uniref:Very-long-chain (3R)-3-hydroxyacyl-CoA dehydratase n=1 Tax=Sparassis crispa TaxID=139825 RepID=A0A401GET0_9APHY|nr:Probable very-long-chain (3R)-3-hydroxyacyl-CoA [Sparassis crispa]GBE80704.1 Probable very-long-chain (3R)-3-hydroxyacyl-CoA [Sparassis crispa]
MAQITEGPNKTRPKRRGQPAVIKYYLVLYNLLSTLGWSYVLFATLTHFLTSAPPSSRLASYLPAFLTHSFPFLQTHRWEKYAPPELIPLFRRASSTYAAVGGVTAIVQSFAVLEIVHALLGWVRSSPLTTFSQVYSRLYVVWGVLHLFPHTRTNPLYASAVLSWSIAEVIRYAFYVCTLLGSEPYALLWVRYTAFLVLYPTGAGSEALLIFDSLPAAFTSPTVLRAVLGQVRGMSWPEVVHADFRAIMFCIWWPSLYMLYTHMMRQRRRVLGGGRTLGAKPKTL